MSDIVEPGVYVSYRNKTHTIKVVGEARHGITGVAMVLYEAMGITMVMEKEEFTKQMMDEDGKAVPRYTKV